MNERQESNQDRRADARTYPSKPFFDPIRQEWQQRTGPNTWLVWKGNWPNGGVTFG